MRARKQDTVTAHVLPADWPLWAVQIMSDEAMEFRRDVEGEWPDYDVLVRKYTTRALRAIERAPRANPDLEAEESWWEREEDGAIESEVENALDRLGQTLYG